MPTRDEVFAHLEGVLERYPEVPRELARSIMVTESRGRADARSHKDAYGPMQLMPATARNLGVDRYDWKQNVEGGVKLLADELRHFKGDEQLAAAAYHSGRPAVQAAGGVPERHDGNISTREYVRRVTGKEPVAGRRRAEEADPLEGGALFSPSTASPVQYAAPAPEPSAFSRGFNTVWPQTQQLAGGAVAGLGDAIGIDSWKQWGLDLYQSKGKEVAELARETDSFSHVLENGGWGEWLKFTAGYVTGQALETVATALAGAAAGSALAPGAGTAAGTFVGFFARPAVKQAVKDQVAAMMTRTAEVALAQGATKEAAQAAAVAAGKEVAQQFVNKQAAKVAGAGALGAFNFVQEYGSIFPELVESVGELGRELDAGDRARALASATGAAALETAADVLNIGGVLRGAKGAGLTRRLATQVPTTAAREAGTEYAQTALEQYGAQRDLTTPEAARERIDAAAVGAVGGTMAGTAAAAHRRAQPEQPPEQPPAAETPPPEAPPKPHISEPGVAVPVEPANLEVREEIGRPEDEREVRTLSTGRVVGSPPGRETVKDRNDLVRRLADTIEHPMALTEKSHRWYEDSGEAIREITRGDRDLIEKVVRLMAVYSRGTQIGSNITATIKSMVQIARGDKQVYAGRFPTQTSEVLDDILTAKKMSTDLPGVDRKVLSFYRNLIDPATGENQFPDDVTQDRWMMRLMGFPAQEDGGNTGLSETQYAYGADVLRRVGRLYKERHGKPLLPRQVQAALWTYVKNRKGAEKARLAGTKFTPKSVSFKDYLESATAEVTWETVPSTSSGILPGIHSAPQKLKAEYTKAARAVLLAKDGGDALMKKVGVTPLHSTALGKGSNAGTITPNVITGVVLPGGRKVDQKTADVYSAAVGYIYTQDAVLWHLPAKNGKAMTAAVRWSGKLNVKQERAFYDHVRKEVPGAEFTKIGNEYRFINLHGDDGKPFSGLTNRKFYDKIQSALNSFESDFEYELRGFKVTTNYIEGGANGKGYLERLRQAGRPDLQEWLDRKRAAVQAVNADFADRYGWSAPAKQVADEAPASAETQNLETKNLAAEYRFQSDENDGVAQKDPSEVPELRDKFHDDAPWDAEEEAHPLTEPRHQRAVAAAISDLLARGLPAAMLDGITSFYIRPGKQAAVYSSRSRSIGITQDVLDEAAAGDKVTIGVLRGYLAHELGHHQDVHDPELVGAETRTYATESADFALDIDFANEQRVPRGKIMVEAVDAWRSGGEIGWLLDYPFAHLDAYGPFTDPRRFSRLLQLETYAQLHRLYFTNPKLLKEKVPSAFALFEETTNEIRSAKQPATISQARRALQQALQRRGAADGGAGDTVLRGTDRANRAGAGRGPPDSGLGVEARPPVLARLNVGEVGEVWRSALKAAIPKAPFAKDGFISTDQLSRWLDARSKDGTFKPDELLWSGLADWLKLQGPKVHKVAVEQFLAKNGMRITEKRADGAYTAYTLPGGYSPRTFLLGWGFRLPPGWRVQEWGNDMYEVVDPDGDQRGIGDSEDEAVADARAADAFPQFKGGHFDEYEPNLIVHVRTKDRAGADDKRVLFLEEIQSDWAERGRKEGFDTNDKRIAELEKLSVELEEERRDIFKRLSETRIGPKHKRLVNEAQLLTTRLREVAAQIIDLRNKFPAIPRGPYVEKTEAWVALALKRMIHFAASKGYDQIAWTTGQQQAERYSLAKQVRQITWGSFEANRGRDVTITVKGGAKISFAIDDKGKVLRNRYNSQRLVGQQLADVIGKELAEKIVAQPSGTIDGEGLTIGGEGMKAFYDKIVVNVANDLLKKMGGGRVVPVNMDAAAMPLVKGVPADQPGFDITAKMREFAAQGMPLFVKEGTTDQGTPERGWPKNKPATGSPDTGSLEVTEKPDWVKAMPPAMQEAIRRGGGWHQRETLPERMAEWKQTIGKRIRQGLFDQFDAIKEYGFRQYMLARMTKSGDSALEALLMYGTIEFDQDGALVSRFERGGFLGILGKLGGEHDRFLQWVVANRAERLLAEGREHNLTPDQIRLLKTLANGTMKDGRNRAEFYNEIRQELDRYNRKVMDLAERAGLINPATRSDWEKDFYVPFYRLLEDGEINGPVLTKGLVNQFAFKTLKGGPQALGDPLHNIIRNWAHLIDASLKNQAAKESLLAAENVGAAVEGDETTIRQMAKAANTQPVSFVEEGKRRWFMLEDPFLLDAIRAIGYSGFNGPAMQVMGKFKRWLTLGVTVSPTYRINNVIRDSLSMIGANPASYNVPMNLATGFAATKRGEPEMGNLLAGGGLIRFGTYLEGDRAEHIKKLLAAGVKSDHILTDTAKIRGALTKMWDWWQDVGDRAENVNRAALYKKLRAEGASHLEASFRARDVHDFSMQGTWAAVRFLTQTVPFFNARLQGLYKLGRGAKEDPRRFGIVMGGTVIATLALLAKYHDDDDWKQREDWDRETFWWFKVGDTAYRIPKPFEIGAIATIVERAFEAAFSDELTGKQFLERVGAIVEQQLSMNPTPQMVKPLIELYANVNSFTERPIEPLGTQQLSRSMRTTPSGSATAQALGSPLVSPAQIDHLVHAYFGWAGTHVVAAADLALRPALGMPERPTKRIDDYLVAGSYMRDLPAYQSKYVTRLYEQIKEVDQAMAGLRHLQRIGALEDARKYAEKNADKLAMHRFYNRAERHLREINQEIRAVQRGGGSAEEKRAKLDELYRLRNELAKVSEEVRRRPERSPPARPTISQPTANAPS